MIIKFLTMLNGSGSPYSPELQAVISYANFMGYTLPSPAQLLNIDIRLILPLKSAGLFSETHDVLYVLRNNGSAGFGGINIIDPFGSFSKVPGAWVSNVGGRLLSTTYQPNGTQKYKINDVSLACISVLVTGNSTIQMKFNGSQIIADANGSLLNINNLGFVVAGGVTGTIWSHGLLVGTSQTLYINNTSASLSGGTPTLPASPLIVGNTMEASSQIAIAGVGASMLNATIKTIYEDWFNNIP